MTARQDPLDRIRAANPVPVPVEPDWDQVKARVASAAGVEADSDQAGVRRNGRRVRRVVSALALSAAVAASILVAVAPWSGSPDFLAKAAAALTPQPDAILYESWEHLIAPEPGNPLRKTEVTLGPEQLWIEDDSPRRYRAVLEPDSNATASRDLASTYGVIVAYDGRGSDRANGQNDVLNRLQLGIAGKPLELGGAAEQKRFGEVPRTLTFLPPNELLSARLGVTLGATLPGPHDVAIENGTDPVSALRAAIAEGRARAAGSTQLDGRTVQRIDLDLPKGLPADAPPLPADAPKFGHAEAYADVEPDTFHPVEIVFGGDTYRFLAYKYLPPTPANLALTNIRAQHPHASIFDPDAGVKHRR